MPATAEQIREAFARIAQITVDVHWVDFVLVNETSGQQYYDRDVLNALWALGMITRPDPREPMARITQTFVDKHFALRGVPEPVYVVRADHWRHVTRTTLVAAHAYRRDCGGYVEPREECALAR